MSKFGPEETPKAAAAFYEYCLLGADRSLAKLARKLGRPAGYARHLETWSSQHSWQDRVRLYDAEQAKVQDVIIAEERARILKSRYALMHKRVELLDRKIQQLVDITDAEKGIWIPDVKSVGTGPDAERVDLVQFNSDAFKELREFLDDIAAELGERVKKADTTVTIVPKTYLDLDESEDGSEP